MVAGSVTTLRIARRFGFGSCRRKSETFAYRIGLLLPPNQLLIEISVPHATDLGIRTPGNEFFFVYSCDARTRSPKWQNFDCDSFAKLARITIDPATFEARLMEPHAKKRRVFSPSGPYTVLLGKNLETENTEQTLSRCSVQFSPTTITKQQDWLPSTRPVQN